MDITANLFQDNIREKRSNFNWIRRTKIILGTRKIRTNILGE